MFHLRYTHVFISNSAWFLGERRVGESKNSRPTGEEILQTIKSTNLDQHVTQHQTEHQNAAGDTTPKSAGNRSMPEKRRAKKSGAQRKSNQQTQKTMRKTLRGYPVFFNSMKFR